MYVHATLEQAYCASGEGCVRDRRGYMGGGGVINIRRQAWTQTHCPRGEAQDLSVPPLSLHLHLSCDLHHR